MPGVGRCPPMRYTASMASVNSTRFRRSGIRKMFASFSNIGPQCASSHLGDDTLSGLLSGDDLSLTAGLGDLFLSGLGELVCMHGQSGRQFAHAEDLHHALARLEHAPGVE